MAENGEEKLLAVARHIAKTLGHNESMADDILQIFSNFDGRFSREKLAENQPGEDGSGVTTLERTLNSLDGQISHFIASDQPIWADPSDSAAFLDTIDELVTITREWTSMAYEKPVGVCLARAGDMHEMAKRMVGAGFGKACSHVYSACRRDFLEESMSRLGLQ